MRAQSIARTYGRRITSNDWVMLATPAGLSIEVQVCVEGDGAIDPAALAAAVTAAGHACPGTRLRRRGRRWVDSGTGPAVRVADAAAFDRGRLDSPLLRVPLARRGGPSCEVVLVAGTPATVVFRAHHAAMDGKGVIVWATEVFRALRGEPAERADSRLTVDAMLADIAAGQGAGLPPRARMADPTWQPLLGDLPAGPRGSMWRRRSIDGTQPGAIAKVMRQILAREKADALVLVPVDLRQFLPGLRTTGVASGTVKVPVRVDDEWSDVQASLLTALGEHQHLANRGAPAMLRVPLPLTRLMRLLLEGRAQRDIETIATVGGVDFVATVSHLGAVSLADFRVAGFAPTSCYSLGGVDFVPEINILESDGRTEVTVAWRDSPAAAAAAEELLDRVEQELSPRENRDWDGSQIHPDPPPDTMTRLLAEQAARTPDATAISGPDGDLSYAELHARAAAVAAGLRDRGAGRGDLVAVVGGRSAATVVAILGILKAGAAYLPIDEAFPDARITQVLTAARPAACLLESAPGPRDYLPPGCPGLPLDDVPALAPDALRSWRDVAAAPDDLAYVMFTSGSTGVPKGVEIEHRALVSYARWSVREAGIDATTRMPLIPSISFDVSGCAIFLPLMSGGTVLPMRTVNAVTLREILEGAGPTVMAVTPSHLELISRAGVRCTTMRAVMAIGEPLRRSTALRALDALGSRCRILNQWGPTETTIANTSHEFDPEADTDSSVPFGIPMGGNAMYLLDTAGRFVVPGEPGEAYVGGTQLARGYLGRPDLTAQRFARLADGTRVYRTGDIVRQLPGGELTFLSRVDDQVKVAGHRVEPAEIAQVLETHPAVRQAAVIARARPGREEKELCGYVICDGACGAAGLGGLKEFVGSRLPRYMVPSAIIAVAEIPLTPSGKVDAKRLPDPFAAMAGPASDDAADGSPGLSAGAAPRDAMTAAVAAIWARTLHVDRRQLDERADFHALGGNSILMISMMEEVALAIAEDRQAEFMNELARVVRDPTLGQVSAIAREIRDGRVEAVDDSEPASA